MAHTTTAEDLRATLGLLIWAVCAFPHGRAYLSACYHLLSRAGGVSVRACVARQILVQLGFPQRRELLWWLSLATQGLSPSPPTTSFSSLLSTAPASFVCYSDASSLALGAWFQSITSVHSDGPCWTQLPVPPGFIVGSTHALGDYGTPAHHDARPLVVSSAWLEAAAVSLGLALWADQWAGSHTRWYTDNETITHAWRRKASSSPIIAAFVRTWMSTCLEYSITLHLCWIPGSVNTVADRISRMQELPAELHSRRKASIEPHRALSIFTADLSIS